MPINCEQGYQTLTKALVFHGPRDIRYKDIRYEGVPDTGRVRGGGVFTDSFDLKDGVDVYSLFDERADDVVKIMITP